MSRARRIISVAVCLLALFAASGGHWIVLQSVAWTRMLVEYSRNAPFLEAARITFSGERPCRMCEMIREGRQQESERAPLLKWERLPEFVPDWVQVGIPLPPVRNGQRSAFVTDTPPEFAFAPPKPVPRPA